MRISDWSSDVCSSDLAAMLLPFVSAGAVLTDPFLTLGVTLSLLALMVAPFFPTAFWRYGFFIGLSIGLLAKGPLALVLIGGASLAWALWAREGRKALKALQDRKSTSLKSSH